MPVVFKLFMAQGECASAFSVVLLVQVGGIMLLDARVVAQHCCYVVHTEYGGMLLSYRLACACAWRAGVFFLVVYGPGGECASGFSVVLLVQVGGIMLLDARVVAQHCFYVLHTSSGMLLSYRLA